MSRSKYIRLYQIDTYEYIYIYSSFNFLLLITITASELAWNMLAEKKEKNYLFEKAKEKKHCEKND